jgi:hypothetical protein
VRSAVTVSSGQVMAPGPGHSVADRSLSIKLSSTAPEGFVVHSFAGDDPIVCRDYVKEKCGIVRANKSNGHQTAPISDNAIDQALRAAIAKQQAPKPKGVLTNTFDYTDENAQLLYQVLKYDPKDFRQRRPDGNGGFIWSLDGVRRVLYRWPELLKYPDGTVFVCEGEKDADRVASLGHCATTVATGKWTDECIQALADRDCLILEDNDETGRKKALEAANALHGVANTIRIVRLPGLREKEDVSDWLDADSRRDSQLVDVCFDAPLWEPVEKEGKSESKNNDAATEEQTDALIQSSAEFVAAYEPPDYLIDGLLQRRFCYSLTAHTGRGKTAVALLIAAHVALGRPLAGREVEKGRVLMFAGENPTDVRQRWIAMSQQMDFDADTIDVHFIPGRFKISALINRICAEVATLGGLSLLIIDTSAAYFEGDDENSNVQLGRHASQMRELRLPGGPTTIINCHPTKNATDDNLLPRGAGAFLAEVDGNLTLKLDDTAIEMHWQGKFRGADFAPINFELCTVTHERLKDTKGRLISTVIAKPLSDTAQEELAKAIRSEEDQLLIVIQANPKASVAELAKAAGWLNSKFEPIKTKAWRALTRLKKAKLIAVERGEYLISEKGAKLLKKLKEKS